MLYTRTVLFLNGEGVKKLNDKEAISLYNHLRKAKNIIDTAKTKNKEMFKTHSDTLGIIMTCFRLPNEQKLK